MSIFTQHSLSLVFERTADWQFDEITISMKMINVLSALDGQRSLAEVAQLLDMQGHEILSCIQRLHDLGLITAEKTTAKPEPHVKKMGTYRGGKIDYAALQSAQQPN